jgi:hypothetical protein
MGNQTYQNLLGIANQLVEQLLNQTPPGADCGVEVLQKLEEEGFLSSRDGKMRYIGDKITIVYDSQADKPFIIGLDANDSDAILEARTVSSKLIEILEDI